MSRTYRKYSNSFEFYWGVEGVPDWYLEITNNTEKRVKAKWKYKSVKGYQQWSLPHWFRNSVNRNRRRRDKQELHKEITKIDYEGLYDPWNCKTSNDWGYY